MIRVLHIINGEFYSGAERVQDLLALRLQEYGYDVCLACIKPFLFPSKCLCRPEQVCRFPMRSKIDLTQALKIAGHIRRHNFRIIHTHTPRALLIGRIASSIARIPVIHHVHSPAGSCTDDLLRNRINRFVERTGLTGVNRIITVSKNLKNHLAAHGINSSRIVVVRNGVPAPGMLPYKTIPDKKWVIGMVALFRPRKGLEVLLKSLAQLKAQKIDFRFRAIGQFETDAYRSKIMQAVKDNNLGQIIDWVGFSKDVYHELQKIDLLVLPSLAGEGTPMVILEAMAAGVPVVSAGIEGIPEIIRHEKEGLLVGPGDSSGLTDALTRIIQGETSWSMVRDNAFKRQLKFYSDTRMAQDTASIYDEVLHK